MAFVIKPVGYCSSSHISSHRGHRGHTFRQAWELLSTISHYSGLLCDYVAVAEHPVKRFENDSLHRRSPALSSPAVSHDTLPTSPACLWLAPRCGALQFPPSRPASLTGMALGFCPCVPKTELQSVKEHGILAARKPLRRSPCFTCSNASVSERVGTAFFGLRPPYGTLTVRTRPPRRIHETAVAYACRSLVNGPLALYMIYPRWKSQVLLSAMNCAIVQQNDPRRAVRFWEPWLRGMRRSSRSEFLSRTVWAKSRTPIRAVPHSFPRTSQYAEMSEGHCFPARHPSREEVAAAGPKMVDDLDQSLQSSRTELPPNMACGSHPDRSFPRFAIVGRL